MRIIAIVSSRNKFALTAEQEELFATRLNIVNERRRAVDPTRYADCRLISSLPRGAIIGVALFSRSFLYDPKLHADDPWILGPYCYEIRECVRLATPIPYKGALGMFRISEEVSGAVWRAPEVRAACERWHREHSIFTPPNESLSSLRGISIRQPMAEAIVMNVKRVENRPRSLGRVSADDATPNPSEELRALCMGDTKKWKAQSGINTNAAASSPAKPRKRAKPSSKSGSSGNPKRRRDLGLISSASPRAPFEYGDLSSPHSGIVRDINGAFGALPPLPPGFADVPPSVVVPGAGASARPKRSRKRSVRGSMYDSYSMDFDAGGRADHGRGGQLPHTLMRRFIVAEVDRGKRVCLRRISVAPAAGSQEATEGQQLQGAAPPSVPPPRGQRRAPRSVAESMKAPSHESFPSSAYRQSPGRMHASSGVSHRPPDAHSPDRRSASPATSSFIRARAGDLRASRHRAHGSVSANEGDVVSLALRTLVDGLNARAVQQGLPASEMLPHVSGLPTLDLPFRAWLLGETLGELEHPTAKDSPRRSSADNHLHPAAPEVRGFGQKEPHPASKQSSPPSRSMNMESNTREGRTFGVAAWRTHPTGIAHSTTAPPRADWSRISSVTSQYSDSLQAYLEAHQLPSSLACQAMFTRKTALS